MATRALVPWTTAWPGGALIGVADGVAREAEQSWKELLADYNLAEGRTWPIVLAWIAAGPAVVRALQERR